MCVCVCVLYDLSPTSFTYTSKIFALKSIWKRQSSVASSSSSSVGEPEYHSDSINKRSCGLVTLLPFPFSGLYTTKSPRLHSFPAP